MSTKTEVHDTIMQLFRDGVALTPVNGDELRVDAPPGVLTDQVVSFLTENKTAVIENRKRALLVRRHVGGIQSAYWHVLAVDEKPVDSDEVRAAEQQAENAIRLFVIGIDTLEAVTHYVTAYYSLMYPARAANVQTVYL